MTAVELLAAVTVLWNTQSVTVPPPKHVVSDSGAVASAVVGLLPTPTFVSVTDVAHSEMLIESTTPEFVTETE